MGRRLAHQRNTGPGRPLLLTEQTLDTLEKATLAGVGMGTAAAACLVSQKSFERWMARGRREIERLEDAADEGIPAEVDPAEAVYVELVHRIDRARAHRAQFAMNAITRAAQGGAVIEETVRSYTDHDGNAVTEKTTKKSGPDWRAAAWYLERRERDVFGKPDRVEVTGADGGAVQVEHGVDLTAVMALAERLRGNLALGEGRVIEGETVT